MTEPSKLPEHVRASLMDPWFHVCLHQSFELTEFVENFDRLCGTNLMRRGAPINLMIDESSGRLEDDMRQFVEFVHTYVYLIVPRPTAEGSVEP